MTAGTAAAVQDDREEWLGDQVVRLTVAILESERQRQVVEKRIRRRAMAEARDQAWLAENAEKQPALRELLRRRRVEFERLRWG